MSVLEAVAIPQPLIKVDVAFYDESEKAKLRSYPTGDRMVELVETGIEVPTPEFLTYYLFHLKRDLKPGFSSFSEISREIRRALVALDNWVIFNGESISSAPDVGYQDRAITEYVGESVGLSVVNRIHGLTDADWGKIPSRGGRGAPPVFDYELGVPLLVASDGESIVQVETKGSAVDNPTAPSASLRAQKYRIDQKKAKIRHREADSNYPYPAGLRYGAITALGSARDAAVRCLLTDPDPDPFELDPFKIRLLNRLSFLANWLGFLSPRSQLVSALETRIADVAALQQPHELDRVPLMRRGGRPFEDPAYQYYSRRPTGFLASKSHVVDGPAGGHVIQLSRDFLYLLGVRSELASLASRQDFKEILGYRAEATQLTKTVRCVFSKGRFERLELPKELADRVDESGGYVSIELDGHLHYSAEGLVHGVLPLVVQA